MASRTSTAAAAADETEAATNTEALPPAPETPAAALGRIVHVVGEAACHNGAEVAPAIITRVWGPDVVNLTVLPDMYMPRHLGSVRLFPDEQAAKQALEGLPQGVAAYWPPRV